MKNFIVVLLTLALVLTSALAFADQREETLVIGDIFILRPLSFVGAVAGTVIYVVSLPIALITGSHDTTYRVLVKDPFEYTFKRPLGEIESKL